MIMLTILIGGPISLQIIIEVDSLPGQEVKELQTIIISIIILLQETEQLQTVTQTNLQEEESFSLLALDSE